MKTIFSKHTFLILLALCVPAIYFLLVPGFYEPHDTHHLADIYEMYRAFTSGQLPPRLGPDFIYGYGYPLFNFYYVLPFYLGAFFYAFLGSLTVSYKLVFLVSVVISVFGIYLFLREYFSKYASIVGAVLFLYTPYRALEIYVRGAMGEALALSLLPYVFWGLSRYLKKPNTGNIALAAFALFLFIIAHNYLWLLSAFWIAGFSVLFLFINKRRWNIFWGLVGIAVLAAGLSAYWWLPAFLEYQLVPSVTPFLMEDHFPFIKQLIIPSWGYGTSVWGPHDGLSFQIGLANLFVILFASTLLFTKKNKLDKKYMLLLLWGMGGFIVSIFFMNIRSLPFWKLLPFYEFVQFPWRLLFLTTFFSSFLAALIIDRSESKNNRLFFIIPFALLLINVVPYFRPNKIFNKPDDQYLSRFFADQSIDGKMGKVSTEYRNYSEDYLLLPDWVKDKPNKLPENKIESESAQISEIVELSPVSWNASVSSNTDDSTVTLHKLYFSGWVGKVDNVIVPTKPEGDFGKVSITVPKGEHQITFYWTETPLRKLSDGLTLVSFGVLTWLAVRKKYREKK